MAAVLIELAALLGELVVGALQLLLPGAELMMGALQLLVLVGQLAPGLLQLLVLSGQALPRFGAAVLDLLRPALLHGAFPAPVGILLAGVLLSGEEGEARERGRGREGGKEGGHGFFRRLRGTRGGRGRLRAQARGRQAVLPRNPDIGNPRRGPHPAARSGPVAGTLSPRTQLPRRGGRSTRSR